MRILLSTAILFVFSAATQAQAVELWSDADLKAKLIGNTLQGSDDGSNYYEYLRPDGAIIGLDSSSGRYEGAWTIEDGKMCFFYYNGMPSQDKDAGVFKDDTVE